jgi:signal transduction histidine kinase
VRPTGQHLGHRPRVLLQCVEVNWLSALAFVALTPRTRPRSTAHHSEVTRFERRFVAASGQTFVALQRSLNAKVVTTRLCAKQLAVFTYVDRANTTNYVTRRVQDEGEDLIEVTRVRHCHCDRAVKPNHSQAAALQGNRLAWEFLVDDARHVEFERIAAEAAAEGVIEKPTLPNIWQFNESGQAETSPRAPLYSVVWVQAPFESQNQSNMVLFNSLEEPKRARAAQAALATNQTTLTGIMRHGFQDPADTVQPISAVYAPAWVYDTYHPPSTPSTVDQRAASVSRGSVCSYSFKWLTVIEESLVSVLESSVLVLRWLDSSGDGDDVYTFSASRGRVSAIAEGDAHRSLTPRKLQKYARSRTLSVAGISRFRVTLYPAREQYRLIVGTTAMRDALIISGLLSLSLIIIILYECVVRRRDRRLTGMLGKQIQDISVMRQSVDLATEREKQAEALVLAGDAEVSQQQHFVATVSHEIRTPLNSVTGAASLLAGGANLTREQRELIDLLQAGAAQVTLIVEDVLLFSALSSGQFPLASEPVMLTTSRGLMEQAVRMIRMVCTKAVTITLDVQPGTPEVILSDPGRLLQVLTNLLGNARKVRVSAPPGMLADAC